MKKYLSIITISMFVAISYASDIEGVGVVTQESNETDVLLFFKDEIQLRSTLGQVDWYHADGSLYASNTDEIYPDEGGYYIKNGTYQSDPVYVFLYTDPASDLALSLIPDCDATTMNLQGDVAPFTYIRPNGTTGTYARACTISYNMLSWNGEEWVDSSATTVATLHEGHYYLPAFYDATQVQICYDAAIRIALGLDSACYSVELLPDDIHAVTLNLTSLATAREDDPQGNNERNRPTSQDLIASSEYSGPLEVAFYSNPTPEAKFYNWSIYKASQRIATRQDKDIRYTFSEPGSYRVVCRVNNRYCTSDSMEVTVNISESYLAVPNIFTPNGDGVNDEFRVAYRSLREFRCQVYNRWGKLVYEWTDPAKGWDGTINGRPAAEGAYYYVIRALGTDAAKNASYGGKVSYQKKKASGDESVIGVYQLSGDINLLRGKK